MTMSRHFIKGMVCIAVLLPAVASASANTFLWPWQHHARRHHSVGHSAVEPPPDCDQINAWVKSHSSERYERALLSATRAQQKIIADCEARP